MAWSDQKTITIKDLFMLPIRPVDIRDETPSTEVSEEIICIFNKLIKSNYSFYGKYSELWFKEVIRIIKLETDQYIFDIPDVLYPKLKEIYGSAGWFVELKRASDERLYFRFFHN